MTITITIIIIIIITIIDNVCYKHGTIMRTGITCKKIPLSKSIEFGIALKWSATHYKQKTEIFLITRPATC